MFTPCANLHIRTCLHFFFIGHFAIASVKLGRNSIVMYSEPDAGAIVTGSLAAFLHLGKEDDDLAVPVEE